MRALELYHKLGESLMGKQIDAHTELVYMDENGDQPPYTVSIQQLLRGQPLVVVISPMDRWARPQPEGLEYMHPRREAEEPAFWSVRKACGPPNAEIKVP